MHSNSSGVADHLVIGVDVGGSEVDDDIHDKHNVHDEVHHSEGATGIATATTL